MSARPGGPSWLRHAGASLIVAGGLATLVGAWWLPPGIAGPTPLGVHAWSLVIGVLLLAWAVAAFATRRKGRDATVLGASLAALAFASSTVVAALTLDDQLSRGWAGPGPGVSLVGSAAGVIGSILVLATARRVQGPPQRSWAGPAVAAAASALAVTMAALGVLAWAPEAGLEASTATASEPPALADDLTGQAWQADMPGRLRQVMAAGPGVASRLDDGVMALDGRTGETRWSYRREGAQTTGMRVSPDGRTLILQWSRGAIDPSDMDPDGEQVFLDTMTGRELHRQALPHVVTSNLSITLSQESFARVSETNDRVVGSSLRTGEMLWDARAPEGCTVPGGYTGSQVAGPAIVAWECTEGDAPPSMTFEGYGEGAEPLWRSEADLPEGDGPTDVFVSTPADGSMLLASAQAMRDGTEALEVDVETGEITTTRAEAFSLYEWQPNFRVSARLGPESRLTVEDRAGAQLAAVDSPCAGNFSLTPTMALVACLEQTPEDALSGRGRVLVTTYEGEQRQIDVDLGGPFQRPEFEEATTALVRAPGAWVAWSSEAPAAGESPTVVGLR